MGNELRILWIRGWGVSSHEIASTRKISMIPNHFIKVIPDIRQRIFNAVVIRKSYAARENDVVNKTRHDTTPRWSLINIICIPTEFKEKSERI